MGSMMSRSVVMDLGRSEGRGVGCEGGWGRGKMSR